MAKEKNPAKNRSQLAIVVGACAMLLYGYVIYGRLHTFQYRNIYLYIIIEIAWLLVTVYWIIQLRKINRREKENDSSN